MSHAASSYTMDLRFCLCPSCGAPVNVSLATGVATCRFCSVQSHLEPRAKTGGFALLPPPRISEAERRNVLLAQTGHLLQPTPRIAPLFARGASTGLWRREDVLAAWQSARKRTAELGKDAHEEADELRYLTLALGNQFVEQKDWVGHRAILESALEASFHPRHRSSIAADLAIGACRQKDLVGAKAWLGLCDPASEDLYADSNYRFARAAVALLEENHAEVLAALGAKAGDVPLHESLVTTSTVSRAHALERLGAVAEAIHELETCMGQGPAERRRVELTAGLTSRCAQSLPVALRATRLRASFVAARTAGGPEPSGLSALFGGGRDARHAAAAENARRLAIEGRDARGDVLAVTPTGEEVDGVPVQRFHLRVEVAGIPPYEAFLDLFLSHARAAALRGGVMFLLVDRNDPRLIAAEATGGGPPED